MHARKFKQYFKCTVATVFVAFAALICIPILQFHEIGRNKTASYILAAIFWTSMLLEQILLRKCSLERKQIRNRSRRRKKEKSKKGLMRFFGTKEAIAAAMVCLISAIATVGLAVFQIQERGAVIISVAIWFLSLNLCCILNGRNYKHIRRQKEGEIRNEE